MRSFFTRVLFCMAIAGSAGAQEPKILRVHSSAGDAFTGLTRPMSWHLVPDSQVYVVASNTALSNLGGLLTGAIDHARSENAAGAAAGSLRIKFDGMLAEAVAAQAERPSVPGIKMVASQDPYDIKLIPQGRLQVADNGNASAEFEIFMAVREGSSDKQKRRYAYSGPELRAVTGAGSWSENDSERLRALAKVAWPKLLEAIALDAAGRLDDALLPEKQRYIRVTRQATGKPLTMVFLGETPETILALPMFRETPVRGLVVVVDRNAARVEATQIEKKPEWKPGD